MSGHNYNSQWSSKVYKDKELRQKVIDVLNKFLFSFLSVRNYFFKNYYTVCQIYDTSYLGVQLFNWCFIPSIENEIIKCQYSFSNGQLISVMYWRGIKHQFNDDSVAFRYLTQASNVRTPCEWRNFVPLTEMMLINCNVYMRRGVKEICPVKMFVI